MSSTSANTNSSSAPSQSQSSSQASQPSKVAIKFLLSNSLTGSLIGSGGKSIKELMDLTHARIQVSNANEPFPGSSDRVILVQGSSAAVTHAQSMLWELMGLMTKNAHDVRSVEWNPRAVSEAPGAHDDVEVTARITVPASAGGAILGRGGSVIQDIASRSGARLSMTTKEEALFTQERVITVAGTVAQARQCVDLIVARLCEQPEIPTFANRGTTYAPPNHVTGDAPRNSRSESGNNGGRDRRSGGERGSGHHRSASGGSHNEEKNGAGSQLDTTINISIPDDLVGNIFGRQGATLREIISISGAKVTVSPRGQYAEGTTNRVVTITGTPTAAQTAHLFITQRIHTPSNPAPRR